MSVTYEWDVELVADGDSDEHEDGEVLDHAHSETLREAIEWSKANPPEPGTRHEIVLVRDKIEPDCFLNRTWAGLEGGKLPEFFYDSIGIDQTKVPKRFHDEVARLNATAQREAGAA